MYFVQVLIGVLGNLCSLCLAGVITVILVLRHSFKKCSKVPIHNNYGLALYKLP